MSLNQKADSRRKNRGFIFTVDALLSVLIVLALVSLVATLQLPSNRSFKYFELEQLGFDSLSVEARGIPVSDAAFEQLTGFKRFHSAEAAQAEAQASGGAFVARARFYSYPRLCGCPLGGVCFVRESDECLRQGDLGLGVYGSNYTEVWVTP